MRVRLIFAIRHNGREYRSPEVLDLPDELAQQLVAEGRAEAQETAEVVVVREPAFQARDPLPQNRDPKVKR